MNNTSKALKRFFSSFGLPAYCRNNIPRNVTVPYITFQNINPAPLSKAMFHAWVFYRGTSNDEITAKVDEIEDVLRDGGKSIPTPTGAVYIMMDDSTPFAQEQPDPDKNIRAMYLTMIIMADTE